MAGAYYHGGGPEIQSDGLQTLYLMNPSYAGYTAEAAATAPANMVLLNSAMNSPGPMGFADAAYSSAQPSHGWHHFVGIPLQEPSRPPPPAIGGGASHDIASMHGLLSRVHYNLWATPPAAAEAANPIDVVSLAEPAPPAQQGLSLSLSSHDMVAPAAVKSPVATEEAKLAETSMLSAPGNPGGGVHRFLMGSKYLKAAQQLLDEVVNVGKEGKGEAGKGAASMKKPVKSGEDSENGGGVRSGQEEPGAKRGGAELTTAERQELQMKKAKLVNMLDEVEQRYRQYHHQMQIVAASFEAVAGPGSARTYTSLALRTISRQFRCLRDTITGQIQAASRSLGEDDAATVGSRLRFIDHQLRQQRALQQLGMMQHNAWRPQRGLPERSVSILRAWLFEHFLHPYPKDSDKIMLAKQTGLTRSQVSNWFINARVRLWKPMVEEMYLEETKDQEQGAAGDSSSKTDAEKDSDNGGMKTGQTESMKANQNGTANPKYSSPVILQPPELGSQHGQSAYYDEEDAMQPKLKKARSDALGCVRVETRPEEVSNRELLMKFMEGGGRAAVDHHGYALNAGGGFTPAYSFDTEQFAPRFNGNGVSLTLSLPHSNGGLSLAGAPPPFLPHNQSMMALGGRRIDMSSSEGSSDPYCTLSTSSNTTGAHPSNVYDINMQDRKSFAAQLMRNFVA